MKGYRTLCRNLAFLAILIFGAAFSCAADGVAHPAAALPLNTGLTAEAIFWSPQVPGEALQLRLLRPDGTLMQKIFPYAEACRLPANDPLLNADGVYQWEMTVVQRAGGGPRREENAGGGPPVAGNAAPSVSGQFLKRQGALVVPSENEPRGNRLMDVVHADDVIITGSLCVGYDCLTDGTESFGFDSIKLKENNLRIYFHDTSTTTGFPSNDWRLTANSPETNGANYFSIDDVTGNTVPFKVLAGARNNAVLINNYGNVGFGTAAPVLPLHVLRGDTPSLRLDQDASSGYTAQVWDLAGNESNFFIRDVTNGSKLPFRIQPGTPTNTLTAKNNGFVGLGTWAPEAGLDLERIGEDATLQVDRTDGAKIGLTAAAADGAVGTKTNHPFRLVTNDSPRLSISADGRVGLGVSDPTYPLQLANGAYCTAGGVWTDACSRDYKTAVETLPADLAARTLQDLRPVTYHYRGAESEAHVGFIAEEAPALVAASDRKGMSPMDVVAVLTRVVQDQQRLVETQQKVIEAQQESLRALEKRLAALEQGK